MPAEMVRMSAKELFSGKAGREYWQTEGRQRPHSGNGRREFAEIIDAVYKDAIKKTRSNARRSGLATRAG
jgi:hypothetical protein